ncbi:MAG TPA: type II CAAX endopeptidase family protein [Roseiflexaceae bacterium]|nr:type II CAAX endopeptidase family protein [Roseiflexaceae bacterium]
MSTATSAHQTDRVISRPKISLIGFFLLVTVASWLGVVPMLIQSWHPGRLPAGSGIFFQLPMFFAPAVVTILVTGWNDGMLGVRKLVSRLLMWRVGWRWYTFVFLAPAVVSFIALQSSPWFEGRVVRLQAPVDVLITFGISVASYLFLNTEELAWRGYALPQLLARYSPGHASLILGLIWGLFHLPLFLLKGGHPAGYPLPVYLVFSLALTVVFTWVTQHAKGSVLLAHLFHQSINGWAEALPFYPRSTGSLAPFLVVVSVLTAGALLVVWRWSRSYRHRDGQAGKTRNRRDEAQHRTGEGR